MRIMLALIFMCSLSALMYLSQLGINETAAGLTNGGSAPILMDTTDTLLDKFDVGDKQVPTDASGFMPSQSPESASLTSIILWPFQVLISWILGVGSVFLGVITAMPTFLAAMQLPYKLIWAISMIWYSVTVLLFVAWLKGNY